MYIYILSYIIISRDTIGDYSGRTKWNCKTTKDPFRPVRFKLKTPQNLNKNGVGGGMVWTHVPTEEKCFNIGQYVFKSYEFKMLNFTKGYAVFLFVK